MIDLGHYKTVKSRTFHCHFSPEKKIAIAMGPLPQLTISFHIEAKSKQAAIVKLAETILLTVSLCTGCEAYVHVCPTAAIEVDHHPKVNEVFNGNDRLTLITGKLRSCEKCGVLFVDKQAEQLCPVCSSIMRNLFRSHR